MSDSIAIAILTAHSIHTRHFGTLQAEEIYTICRNGCCVWARRWVNVNGWTRQQLMEWLGY
jgi:hypothetical protein